MKLYTQNLASIYTVYLLSIFACKKKRIYRAAYTATDPSYRSQTDSKGVYFGHKFDRFA